MTEHRGRPLIHPETREAWRDWLAQHHRSVDGVWLARWTKASGRVPLDYDAIVEEALCFGWIDGLVNTLGGRAPGTSAHASARRERLGAFEQGAG